MNQKSEKDVTVESNCGGENNNNEEEEEDFELKDEPLDKLLQQLRSNFYFIFLFGVVDGDNDDEIVMLNLIWQKGFEWEGWRGEGIGMEEKRIGMNGDERTQFMGF